MAPCLTEDTYRTRTGDLPLSTSLLRDVTNAVFASFGVFVVVGHWNNILFVLCVHCGNHF